MERLMKPAEYAKELGISRQAVYAKIKRGILKAKDVEGKLYIVVEGGEENASSSAPKPETDRKPSQNSASKASSAPLENDVKQEYEVLLAAKDETISVLKGTVKDLKKSNKQITTTLKGEIDLLKEAFYEMRTLYMHQIEHKKSPEAIDVTTEAVVEEEREYVSLKKFFKAYGITSEKKQEKIQKRLKKAQKAGDPRIVKESGKLRVDASADYGDIF